MKDLNGKMFIKQNLKIILLMIKLSLWLIKYKTINVLKVIVSNKKKIIHLRIVDLTFQKKYKIKHHFNLCY